MNRGLARVRMRPCPRVAADIAAADFWALMSADPSPRVIPGGATADAVSLFGTALASGGTSFDFSEPVGAPGGPRYRLSNPGHVVPEAFKVLPRRFPLPRAAASIDLTPLISVGLNGTGQTDLARHYHGVTAMLLLQGRKIWALRPPLDRECVANTGSCTDPLDVCDYYARPGAPPPACVQEAGDTIVLPDGWHHGTCNAADAWTVGWGGQGRRLELRPPACHHCRAAAPLHFATTAEPAIPLHLAKELGAALAAEAVASSTRGSSAAGRWPPLVVLPVYDGPLPLAMRGLFLQFTGQTMDRAARNPSFMRPECLAIRFGRDQRRPRARDGDGGPDGGVPDGDVPDGDDLGGWLTSEAHAYVYAPLAPPPPAEAGAAADGQGRTMVTFRHRASSEAEARGLRPHHAAMWQGAALVELHAGAYVVDRDGGRMLVLDADDGGRSDEGSPALGAVCRMRSDCRRDRLDCLGGNRA